MPKEINKAAQALSRLGHQSMTPEQRKARAQKAAKTRWAQHPKTTKTKKK